MKFITQPPLAIGAAAQYPKSLQLQKRLTFVDAFGEPFCAAKVNEHYIYVPRNLAPYSADVDNRTEGSYVQFDKFYTDTGIRFVPRNKEQAKVWKQSSDLLDKDRSHILEAPTGFGKTAVSMPIIAEMARKTLIVITKNDLRKSWMASLTGILGLDESEIGTIQQDKFEVEGKKVCIAMIHSLVKDKYPQSELDKFGLVIFDEVHLLSAETFQNAAFLLSGKLRLGLSATPQRPDNKDIVFHAHIGKVMVRAKIPPMIPKVFAVKTNYRLSRNWKGEQIYHTPARCQSVFKDMASNSLRNKRICSIVSKAYAKNRRTVIFCNTLVHLDYLRACLINEFDVPEEDTGYYKGGMSAKALKESSHKKIILATYKMMDYGTDIPWLDVCVMATPKANIKQAIGRVMRTWDGKPQPVVIDLVDFDSPILTGFFYKRCKTYKELGCKLIQKGF